MTRPPHACDDDAKGDTRRLAGEVGQGELRAVPGAEGEPGWHPVTGTIAEDASGRGIIGNAAEAIDGAQRGKAYKYRVKSRFEPTSGGGERLIDRACRFAFAR